MSVKIRYCFLIVFLVLLVGTVRVASAQTWTTVTTPEKLWTELNNGNQWIRLSTDLTRPMEDEDKEKIEFVLEEAITGEISLDMNGKTIKYNSAAYNPDAENPPEPYLFRIDIDGGALTVNKADFQNGYSDSGIFYVESGSLIFTDTATFSKNYSEDGGSVLYAVTGFEGSTVHFKGVTKMTSNTSEGDGGALALIGLGTTLTADKAITFTSNISRDGGGGAIYGSGTSMTFDDMFTAKSNEAETYGGAVMLENESSITFNDTTLFESNSTTYGDGGALYASSASTVAFNGNATFKENKAVAGTCGGGAIYGDMESKFVFKAGYTATFESNEAKAGDNFSPGGGAVYLVSSGAPMNEEVEYGWTMDGTASFTKNIAAGSGGAIYAESSALKFAEVTFSNNTSGFVDEDEPGGGGGAIYADMDSYLHFLQTAKFENNKAASGSGGAIYADMVTRFDFEKTATFTNNTAASGGAVYLAGSGSSDWEDPVVAMRFRGGSTFTGNEAVNGGAFYLSDSVVAFGGTTTITGNKATGRGGAFYVLGESMLHFEAGSTTTITGNTGTGKSGAIFVGEDSILNIKLGGLTGSSAATVVIGAEKAANDGIYLASGSSLNINADAGSKLTVHSTLSGAGWDDGETNLNVSGSGTVELKGSTEGFKGNVKVEQGTLVLDRGSVTIGDLENSTIEIADGGTMQVLIDQNGNKDADARVQANSLVIDEDGKFEFDVKSFIMNAEEEAAAGDGFALITLLDPDTDPEAEADDVTAAYELLARYIADGLIDREKSAHFSHNIVTDATTGTTTLYVYVVFDPDTMEWTFNIVSGEKVLDKMLDNTRTIAYDGVLTVNGNGKLVLETAENKVTSLEGNGHLEFDGTLYVNGSGVPVTEVRTYSGNLSGDGAFIKEGGFTQRLLGSSENYTGTFEVRQGTLLGNTDTLRNEINVGADGVLVFDQATIVGLESEPERTFDGTLTGSGAVRIYGQNEIRDPLTDKISDSVLKIDRSNTGFTGTVFADQGWLLLESAGDLSKAGMITIGSEGGLGGSGKAGSVTITEGGAIQAFNGNLTIDGDLILESESIAYTILDGKGINQILVGGSLSVEETATVRIVDVTNDFRLNLFSLTDLFVTEDEDVAWQNFAIPNYTDADGNVWQFTIGADGNVSGKIVGKDDPDPVAVGLSRNQALVAHALATIRPLDTTSPEMKNFIAKLDTFKTTDADGNTVYDQKYLDATRQLAGAVRANGLQLGLYSPFRTVFNRMTLGSDLYGGSPIIYNNGYGPISGMERQGAGAGPITYRGQMDPVNPHFDGGAPMCDIPCMMGENNFWADVTHVQTKTKGDSNSDEYGISRTGLLIGMDFQKRVDSRIGFMFGYFAPYLWQNSDRVEADDYHGGLYFHKNHMGTDLYGYFGYAHQEYRSRRFVDMSAIGADYGRERYNGKTRGDSFNFSLELSKPRYYGHCYVLRPLIAVDYYYTEQKGYRESGPTDGLFGLQYDKAKYDQWFVRVGMNLKKEGARGSTVLRLQYINQFGENAYPDANARFLYTGAPTMNVRGVDLRRDYLNLGLGVNLFMNEARSKFVSFDYDFNTSRRTKSHAFSLVLVERF